MGEGEKVYNGETSVMWRGRDEVCSNSSRVEVNGKAIYRYRVIDAEWKSKRRCG